MQKLELRNNLSEILKQLKSLEIIKMFQSDPVDRSIFLKLAIESKAGYDQAISDLEKKKVFDEFEIVKIYSTDNFSNIISFISTAPAVHNSPLLVTRNVLVSNNVLNDFYSFHKTLVSTFKLIDNLLISNREIFDSKSDFNITEAQNHGNLILEVIDNNNITLKNLTDILNSLQKLIEIIYLLYDKVEQEDFDIFPTVTMIDSGSDINFILKMPEKVANLIAQIIKEFWDFLINNKNYKHEQKLKTLENTITVLGKLKQARDEDIIDAETAEVLKKGIIENTEKIVLNNTLTKQIVTEKREFSNRELLLEQSNRHLLDYENHKNLPNSENTNNTTND